MYISKVIGGLSMKTSKNTFPEKEIMKEEESLVGTLFSTIFFVGGTIVACILLLWILYMVRI